MLTGRLLPLILVCFAGRVAEDLDRLEHGIGNIEELIMSLDGDQLCPFRRPQLVPLCNAAAVLGSKVEMKPSYNDGDIQLEKDGRARSAHENEGRCARRATKCKDNDEEAASAQVQLLPLVSLLSGLIK